MACDKGGEEVITEYQEELMLKWRAGKDPELGPDR